VLEKIIDMEGADWWKQKMVYKLCSSQRTASDLGLILYIQ